MAKATGAYVAAVAVPAANVPAASVVAAALAPTNRRVIKGSESEVSRCIKRVLSSERAKKSSREKN